MAFTGAPRSLGVGDDDRHKIEWVEGESGSSSGDPDDRLVSLAHLIRRYHEAVRGFPAPAGLQILVGAPPTGPLVCHNDLGPVNAIFRARTAVALIDWDLAGPGDERWDLAYAAWRSVPLYDDSFFQERSAPIPDRERRLRLFVDAYGLQQREGFVELIGQRIQSLYDTARVWGGELEQPGWSDVWRDTKGRQWLRSLAFSEQNASRWAAALTAP